jgi:hypothetical protein
MDENVTPTSVVDTRQTPELRFPCLWPSPATDLVQPTCSRHAPVTKWGAGTNKAKGFGGWIEARKEHLKGSKIETQEEVVI